MENLNKRVDKTEKKNSEPKERTFEITQTKKIVIKNKKGWEGENNE